MIKETFEYVGLRLERTVHIGGRVTISAMELEDRNGHSLSPHHVWWQALLRGGQVTVRQEGAVRIVDLFCGTGGLTLGGSLAIEAVGRQPVAMVAVDVDAATLAVYGRNFTPAATRQQNVAAMVDYHVYGRGESSQLAYPPEILDPELAKQVGLTDLLLAGPPCEGHSNLNNHTRRSDPRNQLYVCTAAAAIALHARMVVIENVPDVVADKTEVVATARKILTDVGYHVSQAVLTALEFGGAQTRRRHFTIATLEPHAPLEESRGELARMPMTLQEVIGDLEDAMPSSFMDEIPSLSAENQARINYLFNHDLHDLPNEERPDCHRDGHNYPSVYGRLHWDRPSPTITTGFMTPGRGRYVHPSKRRVITPREAARIQGFPDSFTFSENGHAPPRKLLAKWIGDAVPAQLGYAAVLTALSSL